MRLRLLVVGGVVALLVWWRRRVTWARRWLAHPPGPPRVVALPDRVERRVTRPSTALPAMTASLVIGLPAGLVIGLLAGLVAGLTG